MPNMVYAFCLLGFSPGDNLSGRHFFLTQNLEKKKDKKCKSYET